MHIDVYIQTSGKLTSCIRALTSYTLTSLRTYRRPTQVLYTGCRCKPIRQDGEVQKRRAFEAFIDCDEVVDTSVLVELKDRSKAPPRSSFHRTSARDVVLSTRLQSVFDRNTTGQSSGLSSHVFSQTKRQVDGRASHAILNRASKIMSYRVSQDSWYRTRQTISYRASQAVAQSQLGMNQARPYCRTARSCLVNHKPVPAGSAGPGQAGSAGHGPAGSAGPDPAGSTGPVGQHTSRFVLARRTAHVPVNARSRSLVCRSRWAAGEWFADGLATGEWVSSR